MCFKSIDKRNLSQIVGGKKGKGFWYYFVDGQKGYWSGVVHGFIKSFE